MNTFVIFQSPLFRHDQPDEALDQWFLGEDCARWLHTNLLQNSRLEPHIEPLEEDWGGWTFGLRSGRSAFWFNIWCDHEVDEQWIVQVEPARFTLAWLRISKSRMSLETIASILDEVLTSVEDFYIKGWQAKHPYAA